MSSYSCFYSNNVITQQLDKHVSEATNTYTTIEETLDAVFSMRSVSHQIVSSGRKEND
jgi:hypothetical protein